MRKKLTKQAPELTKSDLDDIKEARLAKVLDLHSRGFTEREISDKLLVSKTTVHNDLVELRAEARKQLQDHIEGLPHAWQVAHTTLNQLIKKAWEMAERKGLEFGEELDMIKVLADLTDSRLKLLVDPSAIDAAVRQKEALLKQLADLKKQEPAYEVEIGTETASGKAGIVSRRIVHKKGKKEPFKPIV